MLPLFPLVMALFRSTSWLRKMNWYTGVKDALRANAFEVDGAGAAVTRQVYIPGSDGQIAARTLPAV